MSDVSRLQRIGEAKLLRIWHWHRLGCFVAGVKASQTLLGRQLTESPKMIHKNGGVVKVWLRTFL